MAYLAKVSKKKNGMLSRIKRSLLESDNQKVEIGFFASQGYHTGADGVSDYTYAGLAQALETGFYPMTPERPISAPMPFMENIMQRTAYGLKTHPKYKKAVRTWAKNLDLDMPPEVIFDVIGEYAIEQSEQVFGNPAYFPMARKGNAEPLVTTGELRDHFTFRPSTTNVVRKR